VSKRQHLRPKKTGAQQGGGGGHVGGLVSSVHEMRSAALAKPGGPGGLANMIRCQEGGWRFFLSFDESCSLWIFSAQLDPIRNTTIDDWRFLGSATAAVGVPPGTAPIGDTIRTAPEVVHK